MSGEYSVTNLADAELAQVFSHCAKLEGITLNKNINIVNFYGSTSCDMRRAVYATAYAKGEAITGTSTATPLMPGASRKMPPAIPLISWLLPEG